MSKNLVLIGYEFSVFTRIAKIIFFEKKLSYEYLECDPFDEKHSDCKKCGHPFSRVPVLIDGNIRIYETQAIAAYLDFIGVSQRLFPLEGTSLARTLQIISILGSYAYIPMIRGVFENRVFLPCTNEKHDESAFLTGLDSSLNVLSAIEDVISESHLLDGKNFTVADCFLSPFIDYFCMAPEGLAALKSFPRLSVWWTKTYSRESVILTRPNITRHY